MQRQLDAQARPSQPVAPEWCWCCCCCTSRLARHAGAFAFVDVDEREAVPCSGNSPDQLQAVRVVVPLLLCLCNRLIHPARASSRVRGQQQRARAAVDGE
jgi:hypothetical protein